MGDPESFDAVQSRQMDADEAWAKTKIEKAENWVDDQADRQRALIPPNDYAGLLAHDATVGILKTGYHLAKGLLGLVWDAGRLVNDPVAREKFGTKVWNGAVRLAKEAWISQGHEGPQAVQDQNERIIAFSKGLWDKVKKSWAEAGDKPGHQTQLVVEVAATIATFFVGGEAALAGDAEKLDEGAAILDEVTQPCKSVAAAQEEAAALAKAKAAEEEAAALAKAKAAEEASAAAKAWKPPKKLSGGKYADKQAEMTGLGKSVDERYPVKIFNESELESRRVVARDGKLVSVETGEPVTTTKDTIYVMDKHGNMYIDESEFGSVHHSSLAGGEEPVAAGHIGAKDGRVTMLNESSGHYGANLKDGASSLAKDELARQGVDTSATVASGYNK